MNDATMTAPQEGIDIIGKLEEIERKLDRLLSAKLEKPWYTTAEFAAMYDRKLYTVREWCRLGRIRAEKRSHGRGSEGEWRICNEERLRYEREGLLPMTAWR